ncbi:beta-carotene 15,15'-monooxygenase [Niastella populi]|uniref:Beta-carotene 15,15'-monooxygenase n=1 Tax=Niastella populi TaxID=550983 RepID=A0A1V9GC58_9BACT|nr:beta-carotene 15,15'-monooxygenase [Niastella populi]OQP68249.1 beta-carotene 15,15'-monooxygenase [Niastella populi]
MGNPIPVFRSWAPEWLIRGSLFLVLLPSIVLFFLPLANIDAAAGYYGCTRADVQFSVVIFYAGYTGFYCLEHRFIAYLASKQYFILFTSLQMTASLVCYFTHELYILLPVRFIQGLLFCSTASLSLSLMFTRLHSERAREVSFSVFFGLLICAIPFNNFVTAGIIDSFNFNVVYKCALFSFVPCLILFLLIMNNVRLKAHFPLHKPDWQSCSLYTLILCLTGYTMVYGQPYEWLHDARIRYSIIAIAALAVIGVLRQRHLKRPYINLQIFSFRNFKVGLLVLFVMYIGRFAVGITNGFLAGVLGFDPKHISYMNLFNLAGLVSGVIIACCMTLQKKPIRYIWLPGFMILLVFHMVMFFLFTAPANGHNYFMPLFIQGVGVGIIMVPTIVYTISSVPVVMGPSAAAVSLATRYLGFCVSIGLINYFEKLGSNSHYNTFRDHLTTIDLPFKQALQTHTQQLMARGMPPAAAARAAYKLVMAGINRQTQLRFAMDYYELISWLLAGMLLLIALFPYLNRTVIYLRSRYLAPV